MTRASRPTPGAGAVVWPSTPISELTPLADYLGTVLRGLRPLPSLEIDLTQAYGNVLAEDVIAPGPAAGLRPRRDRRLRRPLRGPARLRPQPAGPAQRDRRPLRGELATGPADARAPASRSPPARRCRPWPTSSIPANFTDQGIAVGRDLLRPEEGLRRAARRRRDGRRRGARRGRHARHARRSSRSSPRPASAPSWSGRARGSWSSRPATNWSTSAGPASRARSSTSTRTR